MYQNSRACPDGVRVSVVVRFKGNARQRKLLAFGSDGQHRGLNGKRLYFVAVIVPFRVEYGSQNVLRCHPITAGPCYVAQPVGLYYVLYVRDIRQGPDDAGSPDGGIGKGNAIFVRVQQVAGHLLYPDGTLHTQVIVLYGQIVARLEKCGFRPFPGELLQKKLFQVQFVGGLRGLRFVVVRFALGLRVSLRRIDVAVRELNVRKKINIPDGELPGGACRVRERVAAGVLEGLYFDGFRAVVVALHLESVARQLAGRKLNLCRDAVPEPPGVSLLVFLRQVEVHRIVRKGQNVRPQRRNFAVTLRENVVILLPGFPESVSGYGIRVLDVALVFRHPRKAQAVVPVAGRKVLIPAVNVKARYDGSSVYRLPGQAVKAPFYAVFERKRENLAHLLEVQSKRSGGGILYDFRFRSVLLAKVPQNLQAVLS